MSLRVPAPRRPCPTRALACRRRTGIRISCTRAGRGRSWRRPADHSCWRTLAAGSGAWRLARGDSWRGSDGSGRAGLLSLSPTGRLNFSFLGFTGKLRLPMPPQQGHSTKARPARTLQHAQAWRLSWNGESVRAEGLRVSTCLPLRSAGTAAKESCHVTGFRPSLYWWDTAGANHEEANPHRR